MIVSPRVIKAAVGVVILSAAFGIGWVQGSAKCEARHSQALINQIEAGQMLEDARRAVVRQRDDLVRQLEELAHADPVVVERCLGPDRVRRLNAIR